MNKYFRAMYCIPCGIVKTIIIKVFHPIAFRGSLYSMISPLSEITLDNGGVLQIDFGFKMRDGSKIRVRKGAFCKIGKKVSINSNNIITCREKIVIGNNVQLSPNVQIYDHDHDFRTNGGISAGEYKTSRIEIGNNVWIGANVIILRGTKIGDNVVVAAGSVVRGNIPPNTIFYQRRENIIKDY